jgi:large subunit ribosomal protein L31
MEHQMKKNTHPKYQQVLFVDSATDYKFVCGSALQPKETAMFEGVEYPVCRVSVSSASHPFFTGSKQLVDAEGRVDKFKKRYSEAAQKSADAGKQKEQPKEEPKKKAPAKAAPKKPKA